MNTADSVIKIESKIVGWSVNASVTEPQEQPKSVEPIPVKPLRQRPEKLNGSTYKVKTPLSEHAMYITLNDVVIDGQRRPFEIFINCKDMKSYPWIVALTRLMSAVFRNGGDVTFLIDELKFVFDPNGGYFSKGKYVPSVISEIGDVIEQHLIECGLFQRDESLKQAAIAMVQQVDVQHEGLSRCSKCGDTSIVVKEGCEICLSCGASKCS
jgi:hypothetical protein